MKSLLRGAACVSAVSASLCVSAAAEAQGTTYLIVVAGVGGEPKYTAAFTGAASSLARVARDKLGVPDSNIVFLAESGTNDTTRLLRGVANKAAVEGALTKFASRVKVSDQLFIVLIGHGSGQDTDARFNLVGPDMSAADFAAALKPVPAKVAFVNASSASGGFVKALSAPGRVVVTATKSGHERNESIFATHFVAAYTADGADADKDGRVSVLEAFDYARREVARAYEQDKKLLTEHAQLDDNGDGNGTAEPTARTPDGGIARSFFIGGGTASAVATNDPRLAPLVEAKARWETKVDSLRRAKSTMDAATYDREIENALLELAKASQALRDAQARPEKKQ